MTIYQKWFALQIVPRYEIKYGKSRGSRYASIFNFLGLVKCISATLGAFRKCAVRKTTRHHNPSSLFVIDPFLGGQDLIEDCISPL